MVNTGTKPCSFRVGIWYSCVSCYCYIIFIATYGGVFYVHVQCTSYMDMHVQCIRIKGTQPLAPVSECYDMGKGPDNV